MPGTSHPAFAPLVELFEANLADGTEVGASLAVVHDGELVVDLWGGEARPGVPWERDTLVHTWSITKTMSALTMLVLADRGRARSGRAGRDVLAGVLAAPTCSSARCSPTRPATPAGPRASTPPA